MKIWEYKNKEFFIIELPKKYWGMLNNYLANGSLVNLITQKDIKYLKDNPKTTIVFLDEGEASPNYRNFWIENLSFLRKNNSITNKVLYTIQGTGTAKWINSILDSTPDWLTFIESYGSIQYWSADQPRLMNLMGNPLDYIKKTYKKEIFLSNLDIRKTFITFGGKPRISRMLLLDKLHKYLDDQDAFFSYTSQGYRSINKSFFELQDTEHILEKTNYNTVKDTFKKLPLSNISPTDSNIKLYMKDKFLILPRKDLYINTFLDLVQETFANRGIMESNSTRANQNFFTEKIAKAPLCFRPFMVYGNQHYLRDLRRIFKLKTFSNWWDESYDDFSDVRPAINVIIDNIKYLTSLPKSKLLYILEEMTPILLHNNKTIMNHISGKRMWMISLESYVDNTAITFTGKKKTNLSLI